MKKIQENTIYKFTATTLDGKEIALSEYAGKVLLIVNTATHCGHVGQLKTLENVYQQFKDQGFEVLGFPSNQFANQEPLDGNSISEFCSKNYGVSFQLFDKTNVRGKNAHPLFTFFGDKKQNGKIAVHPLWNYYKFLIDRNGQVVDYFFTYTKPDNKRIIKAIKNALHTSPANAKSAFAQ